MKTVEFVTELEGNGKLSIPQQIASKLPKSGTARVILLIDEDAATTSESRLAQAAEALLADYETDRELTSTVRLSGGAT